MKRKGVQDVIISLFGFVQSRNSFLWFGYLIGFVFKKYPNESVPLKIFLMKYRRTPITSVVG